LRNADTGVSRSAAMSKGICIKTHPHAPPCIGTNPDARDHTPDPDTSNRKVIGATHTDFNGAG
jgi:hypothetical protein